MSAIPVSNSRRPFIAACAKKLRRAPTPAEAVLWAALRRRRFPGHRFRRQQPLGGYIADFFCHSLRLIIELDGDVHKKQRGYDAVRDAWLRSRGYSVLRYSNREVLGALDEVMRSIESFVRTTTQADRHEASDRS